MYPKNNLYDLYMKYDQGSRLSQRLPDFTKRYTLEVMNRAINCCEKWDTFLDVGANSGHYSIPLLHKFKQGIAVEATPNKELSDLQKKYSNLTIYEDFIENVSFKQRFDFILLADIFEHIPLVNMDKFLAKLTDTQDKGGIIYVLTPNPIFCGPALESELHYLKNDQEHHGHQKHYGHLELKKIFKDYDYEPLLYSYEVGQAREKLVKYLFSLSLRDKAYLSSPIYRIISAPFIFGIKQVFRFLGYWAYSIEKNNRLDDFGARSLAIIFKKTG